MSLDSFMFLSTFSMQCREVVCIEDCESFKDYLCLLGVNKTKITYRDIYATTIDFVVILMVATIDSDVACCRSMGNVVILIEVVS